MQNRRFTILTQQTGKVAIDPECQKNSPKNMLLPTIYQMTEMAVDDRHGLNTAVNLTGHRTCGFDHLLLYGTLNCIMTK